MHPLEQQHTAGVRAQALTDRWEWEQRGGKRAAGFRGRGIDGEGLPPCGHKHFSDAVPARRPEACRAEGRLPPGDGYLLDLRERLEDLNQGSALRQMEPHLEPSVV